ncbi:DUF3299 domain-containing protein [Mangrovivirga cuniculi]|uniref:DUF3299 domain-containing protein n=1 Tax=Mangrovivirga cuniculi TaxID=2715131 RepID=A0A4D7JD35_9BACT|nr:DUF3299 domain-containing protein [Mangrovivirga cuniculi]QCK13571.1 DUF3299 domain-containing protein [Mangrovivirga cuniculi]
MKNKILIFLITIIPVFGQTKIDWSTLADVQFNQTYDNQLETYFTEPTFGPKVKAIDGKEIIIEGYVIPMDVEKGEFVLSKNPFANCFFCGNAGPETVMELNLKPGHKKFKTDDYVVFKGKFRLNKSDIYHLNYILDDADVVD